jgi:small subunit ribosomal protein S6
LETVTNKLYEAMFLVDSSLAAQDWDGILGTIEGILKRAAAEIVSLRKWGDKKLAYEIDHKARGTYILCYFRADGGRIGDIEQSVRLSERIMRVLILSTEGRTPQDIEKDLAGSPAEDHEAEAAQPDEDIEKDIAETAAEDGGAEAEQEPEVDQTDADDGRISD